MAYAWTISTDRIEMAQEETQHALLIPWGQFAQEIGLLAGIEAVNIKQKTVEHRPQTKVLEFLVAILVCVLEQVSQPFLERQLGLLSRLEYDGDLTGLPVSNTSKSHPGAAYIRWAAAWIKQNAVNDAHALPIATMGIKKQVQAAANTSAKVVQNSEGLLVRFSAASVFAGKQLRFGHPRMHAQPNHFFALFTFFHLIAQKLR